MSNCRIVCLHCRQEFHSPLQFRNAEAFFTCTLVGNTVQCRKCGSETGCGKENMRYVSDGANEGFAGIDTTN